MTPPKGFSVTVGIDLTEIDRVNAAFAAFAEAEGLPAGVGRTMRVAFDELLNNTIRYGFRKRTTGEIAVEVGLDGRLLTVTISDDGRAFDPFAGDDPNTTLSTMARPIGGLGIYIVKKSMDSATYHYVDGKNVVRLTLTVTDS